MGRNDEGTKSYWMGAAQPPAQKPLDRDLSADVGIVGAGIAGLTTAHLLLQKGQSVVIVDGSKIGGGQTQRTTTHLVNAIDDVEDSLKLVDRVRENFPDLPIVSRARNVSHYFELRLRGVTVVERETFEAALKAGRAALEMLGTDRFRAKELADAFRRHNVASVEATLPFYQDEGRRLSIAQQGREELERQFARDREKFEREHGGKGWK